MVAPNVARTKEQREAGLSVSEARIANRTPAGPTKNPDGSIQSARGDEFAPAMNKAIEDSGKSQDEAYSQSSTADLVSYFSGEGGSPSVFSSENAISKIPQLNAKANTLPFYDMPSGTSEQNPEGSYGTDYDTEDLFGLGEDSDKKKKKYEGYAGREGTNFALPSDYWETIYGNAGPEMKTLAAMKQTSDQVAREQIANITQQFEARRAQQESVNQQGVNAVKQALLMGGSSRYAPTSSTGIISAAESEGIKRLSDIDKQERDAITDVRIAQQNGDYQLMEKKFDTLEQIRSEKATAAKELNDASEKTNVQSSRDNAIAGLVQQGVTNPLEILQSLNGGPDGGDFTIKEVGDALKNLDIKGSVDGAFKFDTKQVGPLLGMGFSMQDLQQMQDDFNAGQDINAVLQGVPPEMQQAVKSALGVPEGTADVQPGVGAKDAMTEQMIRTRLFPKVASILNKGALSDSDRKVIDERISYFRDNGLSEQQILDVMSGWSADVSTPFNNSFRDIIIATQPNGEGTSNTLSSVGTILSNGNYKGAMNKVENAALDTVKDQEGYLGKIATETYTQRIDRIKRLLKQGGAWDGIGPLEGNFQNVLKRVKGSNATTIKAELTQLYTTFRKENSGVAVTPSESKFLDSLFAGVTDTKGNFLDKLDVFQRGILDEHNATRRTVNLPQVRVLDILDPNERLNLYAEQVTSDKANSLDI